MAEHEKSRRCPRCHHDDASMLHTHWTCSDSYERELVGVFVQNPRLHKNPLPLTVPHSPAQKVLSNPGFLCKAGLPLQVAITLHGIC